MKSFWTSFTHTHSQAYRADYIHTLITTATSSQLIQSHVPTVNSRTCMVWYGIVGFNVPIDTL